VDYDIIYNMLSNANINFSIGQDKNYNYYINIPADDPYESDVLIEFNSDMSLKKVWAP
jgi:hypothetical protein